MTTTPWSAAAQELAPEVEDYIGTLSPNEALCISRYVLKTVNHAAGNHPHDVASMCLTLHVVEFELFIVDKLVLASVGATQDHPPGGCTCHQDAGFFATVGNRFAARVMDKVKEWGDG